MDCSYLNRCLWRFPLAFHDGAADPASVMSLTLLPKVSDTLARWHKNWERLLRCKYFVAERLSARHLILLRGRLAFVYIYIYIRHAAWERVSIHDVRTCTGTGLRLSCTDHRAEEVATCAATQ